jgi:rod shape determining protein RodA
MTGKTFSLRDFDWTLMMVLLSISGLGVVQIYSTTVNTAFFGVHQKQIAWMLLGIGLMFLLCRIDYHDLLNSAPWLYLAVLGLLLTVLVVGSEIAGAKRWLQVGGVSFQVSEIAKLSVILILAQLFSGTEQRGLSLLDLIKGAVALGIPVLLVSVQPDLGTALTFVPIAIAMLFLAGLKLRYFGLMLLVTAIAIPIAFHNLKPYQKARIATFLDPESDPQRSGYQLMQSKIAVGSGQIWGKGMAQGTQTQLRFLPVPHTDFIFAAFAEEHGFVGVLFTLMLYFALFMRLLQTAETASDAAGMHLVGGIAGILLFQVLINVGMVIGYAPVTGIPLPLMSYGGSSVVFTWMAMGLVNSVRVRRFVN